MQFTTLPIPAHLRHVVEAISLTEHTDTERLAIHVCLNGLPGLVFQQQQGQSPVENITTRTGAAVDIPMLYVYGQMTEPGIMNHKPLPFSSVQVILKPHALYTLLGLNAAMLTNIVVELTEFSTADLPHRLLDTADPHTQAAVIIRFLEAKLCEAQRRDTLIEESLRLIHRQPTTISVKHLLDHLSISERQFERRFRQTIGLSPQFYIRVKRFNAAINVMQAGKFRTLTQVAHTLNFHDQSHFIRDIRAFSGITPKNLVQRINDFQADQRVYAYT